MNENASAPALALRGASISYGGPDVVRAVDLTVAQGEIHVLLGESGSGKTTLLRAVAGFEALSAGSLEIFGAVVDGPSQPTVPPEKRQVGVVFQDYALFPHLDVGQNLAFGMRARDDIRVDELLTAVGLEGYQRRPVSALSGGEQQRVALARALAHAPRVILFDEPFSNLNRSLRRSLRWQTAELLRRREISAMFITHDREEAFALATTLSVMDDGKILQSGPPRALYERPRSVEVAAALGDFSGLAATVTGGRAHTALGEVEIDLGAGDTPDTVIVRPEQVALEDQVDAGAAATVEGIEYGGSHDVVELSVAGGRVLAYARPGSHRCGDQVGVRLLARRLPAVRRAR
ncbi:ABC transporter ATP-binding protein [Haliangium sp.]|uniref:ABC transporter ATP-binding protein n=1 Tax=Haliangium sp. TaxID=2663208 RepID=UPI003D0FF308